MDIKNLNNFLYQNIDTMPGQFAYLKEREQQIAEYQEQSNRIAYNKGILGNAPTLTLKERLSFKKSQQLDVQQVLSGNAQDKDLLENYTSEGKPAASTSTAIFEDHEAQILNMIDGEQSKKMLEMYMDAYISPLYSDAKWRLGPTTGVWMGPGEPVIDPTLLSLSDKKEILIKEKLSTLKQLNGLSETDIDNLFVDRYVNKKLNLHLKDIVRQPISMYTRSDFSFNDSTLFWDGAYLQPLASDSFYTNLFFPPYINNGQTPISDTYNKDAYNLNTFILKNQKYVKENDGSGEVISPTGFTYRDPGFKAISDNIGYIQHLLERVTGVVFTYLTEWDLSLYMQENLLHLNNTGNASKVWMNYRVREDNPLQNNIPAYKGDKALQFNVAGASVSKLFFDNIKPWRPSDYPLSQYWQPYFEEKDFDYSNEKFWNPVQKSYNYIPYPSWYDESLEYSYRMSSFKDAVKHDDYIRMSLSGWKSPEMLYFMAFYYNEGEGLPEASILTDNFIQASLGQDRGKVKLKNLFQQMKDDCIDSGGSNGEPTSSAGNGGDTGKKMARKTRRWLHPKKGGGDVGGISDKRATDKLLAQKQSGPSEMMSNVASKPDQSSMGNYTGINRFSPAIYGGPKGSEYSPNTIQAYFDTDNLFLIKTPRIAPMNLKQIPWKEDQFYNENNKYYVKPAGSFLKSLSLFASGLTHYKWGLMYTQIPEVNAYRGTYVRYYDYYYGNYYSDQYDYYRSSRNRRYYSYVSLPITDKGCSIKYFGKEYIYSYSSYRPYWHSYRNYYDEDYYYWYERERYSYSFYRYGVIKPWAQSWYKKYSLHDEPNVDWQIVTHKFMEYSIHPFWNNWWWRLVRRWWGFWGFRYSYPIIARQKVGYKVAFYGDKDNEKRVMDKMIKFANPTSTKETELFFLEGNEQNRYTKGPESIFKAKVKIKYYATYKTHYIRRFRFWWFGCGWRYYPRRTWTYTPYIHVDINKGVSFFQDKINEDPYSNIFEGNENNSLQLSYIKDSDKVIPNKDVLNKFKNKYKTTFGKETDSSNIIKQDKPFEYIFKDIADKEYKSFKLKLKEPYKGKMYVEYIQGNDISIINNKKDWIQKLEQPINFISGGVTKFANGLNECELLKGVDFDTASKLYPRNRHQIIFDLFGIEGSPKYDKLSTYSKNLYNIKLNKIKDFREKWKWQQKYKFSNEGIRDSEDAQYFPYILYKSGSYPKRVWLKDSDSYGESNHLYRTGPRLNNIKYEWSSTGKVGLSGIGILSQIQGINTVPAGSYMEPSQKYLSLKDKDKYNVPFKKLAFTTKTLAKVSKEIKYNEKGQPYYSATGFPEYRETQMDQGLKNAIINMYTRAIFRPTEEDKPYQVSLDTPFRTLYDIVLRQSSQIQNLKEIMTEIVDFDILLKMTQEYIDKSIQKPSGQTSEGDYIKPDPSHPLYSYWIDRIITILKEKDAKAKVIQQFDERLNIYQWAQNTLEGPCKKLQRDWTWNELYEQNNVQTVLSKLNNITLVEEFAYGYLNVLYEYRKFFICKRFNKQDGTMWVMRQLESILNYVSPNGSNNNPPISPQLLQPKAQTYKVAFYEIQNKTTEKIQSFIDNLELDEDRTTVVYVKVNWVTKKAYDNWLQYNKNPNNNPEQPEVVRIIHGGKERFAIKPQDGLYNLLSKEFLENFKDVQFNKFNPNKPQRDQKRLITPENRDTSENNSSKEIDVQQWFITWKDAPFAKSGWDTSVTPIKYNIFNNINLGSVIEYSKQTVSPEELICIQEDTADFWTVRIPQSIWPRTAGYKTKLKLKLMNTELPESEEFIKGDPYFTQLGTQGYALYPITDKQQRPFPGVMANMKEMQNMLTD